MNTANTSLDSFLDREYAAGFVTAIETDSLPKGLVEDIIRLISAQQERAGIHARVAPARPIGTG